ncbi:MAG TPA: GAF domain-containing protein, partial [Thermoanaerobaculia bacterium]|nr:GAF domain-containing protein [Thermoanaerobaculia bacterium]
MTEKAHAPAPGTPAEAQAARERFLCELSPALMGSADVPASLDWAVGEIGRLLSADRVGLFLFDGRPEEGVLAARASWSDAGIPPLPDTVTGERSAAFAAALAAREAVVSAEASEDPALAPIAAALREQGTRSLLAAPILLDGALRGYLSAATLRAPREWTADERAFLEASARHVAGAGKRIVDLLPQVEARSRYRAR